MKDLIVTAMGQYLDYLNILKPYLREYVNCIMTTQSRNGKCREKEYFIVADAMLYLEDNILRIENGLSTGNVHVIDLEKELPIMITGKGTMSKTYNLSHPPSERILKSPTVGELKEALNYYPDDMDVYMENVTVKKLEINDNDFTLTIRG